MAAVEPVIAVSNLTRRFGASPVLSSVTLEIPRGGVYGLVGANGAERDLSRWNELADREGFIVVYPAGRDTAGPRVWHMTGERNPRYIADLIDELRGEYNIDPKRIYANGLSNGGGMSWALSCRMPDRFAAIGMVGAALLLPSTWCKSTQPVPMIGIHGLRDSAAPYHGGTSWIADTFAPFLSFGADWARRNRCAPNARDVEIRDGVTLREYEPCANNATVALYTLRDGGHTWPGGAELPEWSSERRSGTSTQRLRCGASSSSILGVNLPPARRDEFPVRLRYYG